MSGQPHAPAALPHLINLLYLLNRKLGEHQCFVEEKNHLVLPGLKLSSSIQQPSHYTDWATVQYSICGYQDQRVSCYLPEISILRECKSGLQNTDSTIINGSESYLDNYEGSVLTLLRCSLRVGHRSNSVVNLYMSFITATKRIIFKTLFYVSNWYLRLY
jgi:hypothetical protein